MADWQDVEAFHTTDSERRKHVPAIIDRRPLLDKPSEPNIFLTLLMSDALMTIILTSDGAVMALRDRTTGTKAPTVPASELAAIVTDLDESWAACKTHRRRLEIIKQAQTIGDRLRYAPRSQMRGTTEWKQAIGTDLRPCRVVANDFRVSLRDVIAYRKAFGK